MTTDQSTEEIAMTWLVRLYNPAHREVWACTVEAETEADARTAALVKFYDQISGTTVSH